jgi:hypothetical protein
MSQEDTAECLNKRIDELEDETGEKVDETK